MSLVLKSQFFCLLIVYTFLGLTSSPDRYIDIAVSDLVLHFAGYVALSFSARLAFRPKADARLLLLTLFVYSLLIEVGQIFVAGRSFELTDLLANALGLVAGSVLYALASRIKAGPWRNCAGSRT